jgi:hypothetical protein
MFKHEEITYSCGQKNTITNINNNQQIIASNFVEELTGKTCGELELVEPSSVSPQGCLNLSGQQTKLLKTVVEYLNQASTALYFSNNRFLSSSAKDLAAQLGDQFCVG